MSPSDGRAPLASGRRRTAEGDRQQTREGDNEGDMIPRADRAEGPAGSDQRLSRAIIPELKPQKGCCRKMLSTAADERKAAARVRRGRWFVH